MVNKSELIDLIGEETPSHLLNQLSLGISRWWLSVWSVGLKSESKSSAYYLGFYVLFNLIVVVFVFHGNNVLFRGAYKASKYLHEKLAARVLRAPMSFFGIYCYFLLY